MPVSPPTRNRVFVHVGVPKTGTSFIQAGLRQNKDRLRDLGILHPAEYVAEMYQATLEIRANEKRWGHESGAFTGTWARICERVRSFEGTSVISHELLSGATPEQVRRALAELDGLDVHVVVTARDLGRQLPAAWQQGAKHGGRITFAEFTRRMLDEEQDDAARLFWARQDIPDVLARWRADLPADRVHVITCPRSGAPPNVLWDRFCEVVGIPVAAVELPSGGANTSLGVTEIEVLRRLNGVISHQDDPRLYGRMVNRYYVTKVLRRYSSPRTTLPPTALPRLEQIGKRWVEQIEDAGYDVAGDLSELLPVPATAAEVAAVAGADGLSPEGPTAAVVVVDPDAVAPEDALEVAVATVGDLLREVDRLRTEVKDLRATAQEARKQAHELAEQLESSPRRTLRRAAGRMKRMLSG